MSCDNGYRDRSRAVSRPHARHDPFFMNSRISPPFDARVVDAVVFDVYGTLIDIASAHPYRRLFEFIRALMPNVAREQFAREVMTKSLSLSEAAKHYGVELPPALVEDLAAQLRGDLSSIRPFPDALPTLDTLRLRGYRLGLCSNLAAPYVAPASSVLADLVDVALWSCEVGMLKPDAALFAEAALRLGVAADRCLMVGDSLQADVLGARSAGFQSVHLLRGTAGTASSLDQVCAWLPARVSDGP